MNQNIEAFEELSKKLGEQGFVFSHRDSHQSMESISFFKEIRSFPENGDQMEALVRESEQKIDGVLEQAARFFKARIKESFSFKLREWTPGIELTISVPWIEDAAGQKPL